MSFIEPRAFTPNEFRAYVATVQWAGWKPDCIVLHNTGVPSLKQWMQSGIGKEPGLQRCRNLNHYYRHTMGWSSGPHLFIAPDYIFVTCDLRAYGVHASCFNRHSLGIEMVGDYNAEAFGAGDSARVRDNAVAALHILFDALHITPSELTLKFHRECLQDHHQCPGDNVHKADILHRISTYDKPVIPPHEAVGHDGVAHTKDHSAPVPVTVAELSTVKPKSFSVNNVTYYSWQIETAKEIYAYFNGKKTDILDGKSLAPHHAAAFVEMADAESSFRLDVWGDYDVAAGLWQLHLGGRLEYACAAIHVPTPAPGRNLNLTVKQQCDMAWADINSSPEVSVFHALEILLHTTTAYDAGAVLTRLWERCGAPGQQKKRGDGAEAWLKYLTAT